MLALCFDLLYYGTMPKIVTFEDFIARFKDSNKDAPYDYDYSQVPRDIIGADIITVGCPKHGEFDVEVLAHSRGKGCPGCKQDAAAAYFLIRARDAHGDTYDYSLVEFAGMRNKVTIICPVHGEFEQVAKHHVDGAGCRECGTESMTRKAQRPRPYRRKPKAETATKRGDAQPVVPARGERFGDILGVDGPVHAVCDPETAKVSFKRGGTHRMTPSVFLARAYEAHGDKYDYADVVYVNKDTKVVIVCPVHGAFEQTPGNHLKGKGCRRCSGYAKLTQDEFVARAQQVHADADGEPLYDYSDTVFTTTAEKVTVACPVHGPFTQTANSHLMGHGCPGCGNVRRFANVDYAARAEAREATVRERYGVDNMMQVEEFKEKQQASVEQHYGVTNPMKSPVVKQTRRDTLIARYGATSYIGSNEGKERIAATNLERYGHEYAMSDPKVAAKAMETRKANGTLNTSKGEALMYERLVSIFGVDDVLREHATDVYPWRCDFYIPSRDLYIELNAHQSHGYMWFDEHDPAHLDRVTPANTSVWTVRDVEKRKAAAAHELNYVVFWDPRIRDFDVWVACGLPDAQDWKRMYSWLPERDLSVPDGVLMWPRTANARDVSRYVAQRHYNVFYGREIAFFNGEDWVRDLRPDMRLYHNRIEHHRQNKTPFEFTNTEVLSGLRASRLVQPFTHFDTKAMRAFLRDYDIDAVYDPCAGWGERMMTCASMGVSYVGVDINPALVPGYSTLIAEVQSGMFAPLQSQQVFVNADSASFEVRPGDFDAVVTCPPYGGIEIYSQYGIENAPEASFVAWWDQVVARAAAADIDLFCFVINQRWKKRLSDVVEAHGYEFVQAYDMASRSSYMTRTAGANRKKEYEEFLVFRRKP